MSRYAVIGHPVSHSKSPLIHRLFAQQTGQEIDYTAIEVLPEDVAGFLSQFFSSGGAGLNVTVPHKEAVYRLVRIRTERAEIARAVNTLFRNSQGELCGDNTDGTGLVADLKSNNNIQIKGKHVLMLGAGGAVRGSLSALIAEAPASLTLVNRTVARAQTLQQEFRQMFDMAVADYAALRGRKFDLIINGTSMGLTGESPPLEPTVIAPHCCCYDMVYGKGDTAFVRWARENRAEKALDGLGMLVEQAAESYRIWHGIKPETGSVILKVRRELN